MSEPKGANSDPSMDDILASIRKIISDDEARAQVINQPVAKQPAISQPVNNEPVVARASSVSSSAGSPGAAAARRPSVGHDDVLLLTDFIEDSAIEGGKAIPIRLPRTDMARAAQKTQATFTPTTMPPPTMPPATIPPATLPLNTTPLATRPVADTPVATLVGSVTADATTLALARLDQAVQDSVPAPAAHDPGPAIDSNGRTVEDLVEEMLRPMLKEWLDRNLPPLVERYVEREIVRLTRR